MHLTKDWKVAVLLALLALAAIVAAAYANPRRATPTPRSDLTTSEAEALIVREGLLAKVEAAMGDAFGGAWLDRSTGQMQVGVTDSGGRSAAEASAARAVLAGLVATVPVESSWSQLQAAQRQLNQDLEDLFAQGEVKTSLDPEKNSVAVELGSGVGAARLAQLHRQAAGLGVSVSVAIAPTPSLAGRPTAGRCNKFVKAKENANCDKPIVGGASIVSATGTLCSAGAAILLKDRSTVEKSTLTYLLTAGHCVIGGGGVGTEWFAFNKKGEKKLIGKALEGTFGAKGKVDKVDAGVIKVNNPGEWVLEGEKALTPVTPATAQWKKEEEHEPVAVTAQGGLPLKNTEVCYSGRTSGTHCGFVFATNVTVPFEEEGKEKATIETLVEVRAKEKEIVLESGDSGGPWFPRAKTGELLGTSVGTLNASTSVYEPLASSFENLATEYQLLTTANEKRE